MTGAQYCKIGNIQIRYLVTEPQAPIRGHIVILPGFTEFIEKHALQVEFFASLGLRSLVLDWPSQGLSSRLNPRYPDLVHATDFKDHLQAALAVIDCAGFQDRRLFLLGHSMGGHLALRLASSDCLTVLGAMVSAPMVAPPITPLRGIKFLLDILCACGLSGYPLPFHQSRKRSADFYADNPLTTDPAGYRVQFDLFESNPALRVLGPSFGWARAAYRSCLATTANARFMSAVSCPVQAHLAGDERVVAGQYSRPYLRHIPNIEIYDYVDARHELLLERQEVQSLICRRFADFIAAHLPN